MEITRRSLLKLGAVLGIGSALPGCAKKIVLKPKEEPLPFRGDEKVVSTICGMCPAGCALGVRKIGEWAVGLAGLPDHPISQGSLCPKGAAGLQELYHPERIRGPLLRQGDRGEGHWQPISWDEALRLIVDKIRKTRSQRRSNFFDVITGSPTQDLAQELLRNLAHEVGGGGVSVLGFPIGDGPFDAYRNMHGNQNVFLDITKPRLLVSFSFDWIQSHPSSVEAQRAYAELRQGLNRPRAHLVAIEPRFSVTAAKADEWIPIRPGTEGFLALALVRTLIDNGTYDKDFVAGHTHGFEAFRKSLEVCSPDAVSRATGVSPDKIRLLALKFFSLKPAAVIGAQGTAPNQMAVHALNAILGSIGPGRPFLTGNSEENFYFNDSKGFGMGELPLPPDPGTSPGGSPTPMRGSPSATGFKGNSPMPNPYNDSDTGDFLPKILLVDRANPLFLDPLRWRPIFEKASFVAAVSPHLTETAQFADLILPCHTPLEAWHLSRHVSMQGRPVTNAARGAVGPLYDTKDAGEIYLSLKLALVGRKMEVEAFPDYVKGRIRELGVGQLIEENDSAATWLSGTRNVGQKLVFSTPSGKFEFGPLAKSIQEPSFTGPPSSEDFPLSLYLFAPLAFSRGEGAHLPYLLDIAGPQIEEMWGTWAELHPDTAQINGVSDGQMIWIESPRGKIKAKARVLSRAMPGVVSVPLGMGHTAYGRWAKGLGSNPLEIASMNQSERVRISRT